MIATFLVKTKGADAYEMTGTELFTEIVMGIDAEPPVLVAVIEYEVAPDTAVGVPVITQALEMLRPAGRLGLDEQLVGVPPELEGVCVEIAEPVVKVKGEPA